MPNEPQKELTGVLFKEEKNPKIDYSGSATIDGQEYYINGWKKVSASGKSRLSLSFKAKEAKLASKPYDPQNRGPIQDEDIPF